MIGVVICGGKSSRMGSDKSLLLWQGIPFYKHAAQSLSGVCSKVFISCNQSQKHNYDLPVIVDNYENIGPMAGIITSIEDLDGQSFITIPCDMPLFDHSILQKMIEINNDHVDGIFLKDNSGQVEPLVALYNPTIKSKLQNAVKSENYSLKYFIENCPNVSFIQLHQDQILNINSPADFENFKISNDG